MFFQVLMGIVLLLVSLFMILLILVQRGRGGGLTGALGGMGGQSAFGSRAGDVFTRITVVSAIVWILACMLTIAYFNRPEAPRDDEDNTVTVSSNLDAMQRSNTYDLREQNRFPAMENGSLEPSQDPPVIDGNADGDATNGGESDQPETGAEDADPPANQEGGGDDSAGSVEGTESGAGGGEAGSESGEAGGNSGGEDGTTAAPPANADNGSGDAGDSGSGDSGSGDSGSGDSGDGGGNTDGNSDDGSNNR